MEEKTLMLFMQIRERFGDIKDKVSLIKPYLDLMVFSKGWALKIEEFEKILSFKPEFLYKSNEEVYAISVLYRVDDDVTTGVIAHEFAEIVAREKDITDQESIDNICVEKGFGKQLLYALQNDLLVGIPENVFIGMQDLERRVGRLKRMLDHQT